MDESSNVAWYFKHWNEWYETQCVRAVVLECGYVITLYYGHFIFPQLNKANVLLLHWTWMNVMEVSTRWGRGKGNSPTWADMVTTVTEPALWN